MKEPITIENEIIFLEDLLIKVAKLRFTDPDILQLSVLMKTAIAHYKGDVKTMYSYGWNIKTDLADAKNIKMHESFKQQQEEFDYVSAAFKNHLNQQLKDLRSI